MSKITESIIPKKRGRKRKSKRYFTNITQIAILAYRALPEESTKRDRIYKRFIHEPMTKLIENTINNSTKGYHDHVLAKIGFETLAHITLIHNISKFKNYNPDKGPAFSYFNIIGRNFIINENKSAYKELKLRAIIDVVDDERNITNEVNRQEFVTDLEEFTDLYCEYWEDNIRFHFTKSKDIKIANALIYLFRNRENIEEFYKRNLYIIIRERTGIEKTQHITSVVKEMKDMFKKMFETFRRTGRLIDDDNIDFTY